MGELRPDAADNNHNEYENEVVATATMLRDAREAIGRLEDRIRLYYAQPFTGDLSQLSEVDGYAAALEQLKNQYNESIRTLATFPPDVAAAILEKA